MKNNQQDEYLVQALEFCAKRMLFGRQFDVRKNKPTPSFIQRHGTLIEALNDCIGHGGGFSFTGIGDYWFCDHYPGIRIQLLKGHDDDIISVKISRSCFLSIAQKIWDQEKHGQLTLFEYEKQY